MIVIYFVFLIIVGIFSNLFTNNYYDNSWSVGEWLISYSGGFIRRGLFGSLIYNIANFTDKNPIIFVHFVSIISYLVFLYLLKYSKKYFSTIFLLSPIVSLSPVLNDFLIRKDVIGIAAYGVCTLILKRGKDFKSFLLLNGISIIAILNHESFVFYAIPSFIVLHIFYSSILREKKLINFLANSIIFFLPTLIISFLVFQFKGSPSIAMDIHKSWQELSSVLPSKGSLFDNSPSGAIEAIGWDLRNSRELLIKAIAGVNSTSFILYVPAVWMLTIFGVAQIFIGDGKQIFANLKANVLLVQFASISPLFILGWDYGRWIFLWIASSIFFASSLIEIANGDKSKIARIENLSPYFILKRIKGIKLRGKWNILYLFISLPACCWSISHYFWKTAAFYPLSLIIK